MKGLRKLFRTIGSKVMEIRFAAHPGNQEAYSLENIQTNPESPLSGKKIIFLGSSITEGCGGMSVSFVDDLVKKDGIQAIKEAVGGTTLVDNGENSYIARMKTIDPAFPAELFVCQLSTNDAGKGLPLGTVSLSRKKEDFDTSTVAGAIEYVIAYAEETWHCPVIFYTNPRYESAAYAAMVGLLQEIQKKWDIRLIDLWNDAAFNAISKEAHALYMVDAVHPSRAGYLEWWLPVFEEALA